MIIQLSYRCTLITSNKDDKTLKNKIIFSKINDNDWSEIQVIENQIYPNPWSKKTMQSCLDAGYQCLKGQFEGHDDIVCYGFLMIGFRETNLLNLSVNPAYQRQGIASSLLQRFLLISRINQAKHLWLEVRESNHAAIKLYQKFGFEKNGLRTNYYKYTNAAGEQIKEHAILMSKKIP